MKAAIFKEALINQVQTALQNAEYQSYKLILVIIPQELYSEVERELLNNSVDLVNLSKKLSYKLVSQSIKDRVRYLEDEVTEIVSKCSYSSWMTKLDVLFEPSLESDPMKLLKIVARFQPLVVIWPGEMTETSVVYSKPGKSDYKSYLLKDLTDIQVVDACNGVIQ